MEKIKYNIKYYIKYYIPGKTTYVPCHDVEAVFVGGGGGVLGAHSYVPGGGSDVEHVG